MIEQQISDIPLSPQISPIKEQPSQEEHESSSPSETTEVEIGEKTQSQEEYESSPPSETTKVAIEETVVATTEEDNKLTSTPPAVEETFLSEEVIVNSENSTDEQEVNNNKDTTSITEGDIKEESSLYNIEAAQLEIAEILSNSDNNNNSTINVEDKTDRQTEKELPPSPLLTCVAYDDKLDNLQQTSASSQEATATMPLQHLEFEVIHATTWDDNYPPEQLLPKAKSSSNGEIKYGKGWQSERLCKYPQEIILQVSCGSARIRRLQILSHHYKIATKLEIYVGSVQRRKDLVGVETNTGSSHDEKRTLSWDKFPKIIENDGIESDDEGSNSEENDYDMIRSNNEPYILFRRLGYCALDSNERSNYRARELKSVRLDTEGEYIRLVARRCYENHLNQHNQVGIVGITVTGEPVDHLLAGESRTIPIEHADEGVSRVASPETCIVPSIQENNWMISNDPNDQRNFTSLYSILPKSSLSAPNNNSSTTTNPLPNDANNDAQTNINNPIIANDFLLNGEGTEKLLAAFSRAKQKAVKVEDFHLAKVLKFFTELIQKAAEDVCKYDVLKKQAVEEEDFDNADKYKQEIESIRLEIRDSLADEGIDLDESGEVTMHDLSDIIGLADTENTLENQQSDPNVNEEYLLATSSHIPKSRSNSNASIDRASGARAPEPMLPLIPKSRTSSDASMNRYLGGNNYNNYACEQQEEPTTPTTPTHSTTPLPWTPFSDDRNPSSTEVVVAHVPQNLAEKEPEPLTKLARIAFVSSILSFGDHVVACLLSTQYHLRDSALIQVTNRIDIDADGLNVDGIDKLSLVKGTYQVIQEALNDNREDYTLQVLLLWKKLIKFCVHHQIPNVSTWKSVEVNYESLFSKTSNTNDQIKQKSIDLFILLAKTYKTPTQSVLSLILKPAKTQSQPLKKAKPTIELIIRLIEEFGVIQIQNQKIKFDKDNKLSLAALMEISISYLNNNNEEVCLTAVKLVFEIVKRIGRENVEPYLAEDEIESSLLEMIRTLVTEWEEKSVKIAGDIPSPPPSPEQSPKGLTEGGKDAIKQPLAKRGTVDRIEQQLMEVQYRINNTNNLAKKPFDQDEVDEEEELRLEAQLIAEIEEIEALEAETKEEPEPKPKVKGTIASKKVPTARGSKPAAPSKSAPAKKPKDDGKAAPSKKTTTSKTSAAKSVPRRGSTDDVKSSSKSARKNSINNNSNVPSKLTSEPVTDEPDELKDDRRCIFCDERDDRYTEENLVTHYWNDCPVLTNCRLCNIILEISTLDDHMLNDCDKSKFVKQCPRCREVIGADDYLEHMAKQSCMAIRQDIVRCPLCKATVKPATEAGWKAHLIDENENGCTKNRRKSKTSTSMVKEMEAAATAEKREKKSTSATKSSVTSKAPTRKPTAASKDKPKKASTAKVTKAKK